MANYPKCPTCGAIGRIGAYHTPCGCMPPSQAPRFSVIVGINPGAENYNQEGCVVIGAFVPLPDRDDTIRIGSGNIYLEIDPTGARIVGTNDCNAAVREFLAGIDHASDLVYQTFSRIAPKGD